MKKGFYFTGAVIIAIACCSQVLFALTTKDKIRQLALKSSVSKQPEDAAAEWIVFQKRTVARTGKSLMRFKSSLKRMERGAVNFTVLKRLSVNSKKLLLKRFSSSLSFERNQVASISDGAGEEYFGGTQQIPWGVERVGATKVWSNDPASRGYGIKVAVIDTGVASTHPDLYGRVKSGVNILNPGASCEDDHGHGSHVAGIIAANHNDIGVAGVAPESDIYCVKVLDSRGAGRIDGVASGINWAISKGVNVINMSLGFRDASYTVEAAIKSAYDAGIVTVVAAGNGGIRGILYPARYPEVVSVAAINKDGLLASFSANGRDLIDVAAPGVAIPSTITNNSYASWSGTSMAAPHVSGAVALMLAKSGLCGGRCAPQQIESILKKTSTGVLLSSGYGYGELSLTAALNGSSENNDNNGDNGNNGNIDIGELPAGDSIPRIIDDPKTQIVLEGTDLKLTVTASGGNLNYIWYINNQVKQSGTSNTLNINNISSAYSGSEVYVIVKNAAGEARSKNAIIRVF